MNWDGAKAGILQFRDPDYPGFLGSPRLATGAQTAPGPSPVPHITAVSRAENDLPLAMAVEILFLAAAPGQPRGQCQPVSSPGLAHAAFFSRGVIVGVLGVEMEQRAYSARSLGFSFTPWMIWA